MANRQTSRGGDHYDVAFEAEYYAKSALDRRVTPLSQLVPYLGQFYSRGAFEGKRVLDIGCGEGIYTAFLASWLGARFSVGVELTPHRIRTDFMNDHPNVLYVCGDAFRLPAKSESFDIVFMNLVLHHVMKSLDGFLKCAVSALKPGGEFIAIEPNVLNPLGVLLHWWHDRSPNEGFLFPSTAIRAAKRAGLEDVSVEYFWRDRRWARNAALGSAYLLRGRKS